MSGSEGAIIAIDGLKSYGIFILTSYWNICYSKFQIIAWLSRRSTLCAGRELPRMFATYLDS